jgi:hypothetical protein
MIIPGEVPPGEEGNANRFKPSGRQPVGHDTYTLFARGRAVNDACQEHSGWIEPRVDIVDACKAACSPLHTRSALHAVICSVLRRLVRGPILVAPKPAQA